MYLETDLISAVSAQWLIKELRARGFRTSRLLEGTKFGTDWIDSENATFTHQEHKQIVENALNMTNDNALGLKLGRTPNLALFGVYGYAIMSSKTLKDAANIFIMYQDLPGQFTRINMDQCESIWTVRFEPLYPFEDRLLVWAIEDIVSLTYHSMILLTNKDIDLVEISLSYMPPDHAGLYEEIFHCPIKFMALENYIRLDARLLDLPIATANPIVYQQCTQYCEKMLKGLRKADQFIDRIRNTILTKPGRFPKAGEVAKELGMSTRSLNRKLQERKTQYRKILNEIRCDLSMKYLADSGLSIDQISDLVGFSDTAVFRRAFKKWTHKNAFQYRKEIRGSSNSL